jgi:hypothetical protein
MEEKEMKKFSFMALPLVTGFCFLSFALVLKILDGINNKFFLWIGLITLASGILTGFFNKFVNKTRKQSRS